ncbi:periplasmic binding protein-like II [Xylona heveae TC161]|uniref:Periplasmic binding protein-like II n=1 Tax=Xylona heveae (strain CBS 132557 / TC161) TaxID=1328760 RepID=A0A165ADS7_XYLHT|nr:periplasmic binding protein-like II [Xylona heveae TC161]KZF20311.1 periplasmic binding protein-like II [Xylona heveae TC161]
MSSQLRIGFVPEHFSTPLHFAQKYFGLNATLVPFPSGTGHMIQSLKAKEIDIGIGLTEGWIAGLGKEGEKAGYKLVGTYVETPLCWAISTGANRDLKDVTQLKGANVGVSRIGSGSYVMSFVLADQQGWLEPSQPAPFTFLPLQTFASLRQGVNEGTADFFMWEHFTSKRYYDNGEIKRIGEIYTPWSSWKIVVADAVAGDEARLGSMFEAINKGVKYFQEHLDEAVQYISTNLDYSEEDAREWLKTVRFADNVKGVDVEVVKRTKDILLKAGVIESGVQSLSPEAMISVSRK